MAAAKVLIPAGHARRRLHGAAALDRGIALGADAIAIDGGSTDSGPAYLGRAMAKMPAQAIAADLRLMLVKGAAAGIPVIVGSAGTSGTDVRGRLGRVAGRGDRRRGAADPPRGPHLLRADEGRAALPPGGRPNRTAGAVTAPDRRAPRPLRPHRRPPRRGAVHRAPWTPAPTWSSPAGRPTPPSSRPPPCAPGAHPARPGTPPRPPSAVGSARPTPGAAASWSRSTTTGSPSNRWT